MLPFKHGDRTDIARACGGWMARAGADLLADADLVAPVPLHWRRLFTRRYNQAQLLARIAVAAAPSTRARLIPDLMRRRRWTGSQTGLRRQAAPRQCPAGFRPQSALGGDGRGKVRSA